MRNLVATLDIGYASCITDLTFPLMESYAATIDADFEVISQRRWPHLPVTLEKMQLYDLADKRAWTMFFDADCVVNPGAAEPDWCSHEGVWISQRLPLTQFSVTLAQHAPTYFFAFPAHHKNCVTMPESPEDLIGCVNHPDAHRRQWLLDDLIFNLNITRANIPCRVIPPGLVAHLGYEGCDLEQKLAFVQAQINCLRFSYQ